MELDLPISTLEELFAHISKKNNYVIGIPLERGETERRVGLTPQAVSIFIEAGYEVMVEKNAGLGSGFTDMEYSDKGACIVEDVFRADIIFKIAPLTLDEIAKLQNNATVFSIAHNRSQSKEYFSRLMHKKVTAIAYDDLRDKKGNLIVMDTLCKIIGNACPLIAGEYFSLSKDGYIIGSIAGIPPTEIVFLGATKVAETAAKIFLSMETSVKIFDCSLSRLQNIKQILGTSVYTSILYPDLLEDAVTKADLVIADSFFRANNEYLISEDTVRRMKRGSLIIDVGITHGSKIETSHLTTLEKPFYTKYNVAHYCVPNISARFPKTSSQAISNILSPILMELSKGLSFQELLTIHKSLRSGIYIYKGILTDEYVAAKYGFSSKKLDLLLDFSMS